MRSLSRLLIVLILCLVYIAVPGVPAQAVDGGPYITLSPSQQVPGEEVTVYGGNFTGDDDVWVDVYYDLDADEEWEWVDDEFVATGTTEHDGSFEVTFTVPESFTGNHMVQVRDKGGKKASADFTVEPGLTISPNKGPVGTIVTVKGHGFAADEEDIELRYYLNGSDELVAENIEADENGSWNWTFPIPPSIRGEHKIDAEGDDSALAYVQDVIFTVTPGISLGKSSGTVGAKITMTGSGFVAGERDIKIFFDGEETDTDPDIIRADPIGHWQAIFEVPEMPKGTYSVTAEGESTEDVSELSFQVEPGLALPSGEGYVGMNLTVTGQGFAPSKHVTIAYDGSQKATATTDNKGSFEAVFTVPESQHGGHQVTAEVAGEIEAIGSFTMESTPPNRPNAISPPDGTRVGFIGSVRPTFEWSEVSDDSGVRYSLQLAGSDNVTIAGFAHPIVSVPNIVGTKYTLNATEAVPNGTYYWIVQAVDRAGNKGAWTEPVLLRVGLLPPWALILCIVAVVALIGGLVYFFVMRRRKVKYY